MEQMFDSYKMYCKQNYACVNYLHINNIVNIHLLMKHFYENHNNCIEWDFFIEISENKNHAIKKRIHERTVMTFYYKVTPLGMINNIYD